MRIAISFPFYPALMARLRVRPTCLQRLLSVAVLVLGAYTSIAENTSTPLTQSSDPYVLVLGTAQDGGLPHIGCSKAHCTAARQDAKHRRLVASLLVVDPRSGKRWLIDATPDIGEQVELARPHPVTRRVEGRRPPLFDGIFLTHAHMGHYAGLVQLGRPAYGAKKVPVYGSAQMCAFLEGNGPWDLLVKNENIVPHRLQYEEPLTLGEGLTITGIPVPHRAEYTDTLGYIIRGPKRSILYIPDIDKWEKWDRSIEEIIATVDAALLDGTFFEDGEIPGRSMADIPHPFISESVGRFAALPDAERKKIIFTHLNHSNPATNPESAATALVQKQGMSIAREGQHLDL